MLSKPAIRSLANSRKLIESQYGLPIDIYLFDRDIHILRGNMLIDGLLSFYKPAYTGENNYQFGYVSFIEEYERWLGLF